MNAMMVCLDRSREYKELQQRGAFTPLILSRSSEKSATYSSNEPETALTMCAALKKFTSGFAMRNQATNMIMSAQVLATLPNQRFLSATDITMISASNMLMDPKEGTKPLKLSNMAKSRIAAAIGELETEQCKTFSSIDEFFADLESD